MQEGCEENHQAVLHNIMYGREAQRVINTADTPFVTRFYGPPSHGHHGKYNIVFLFLLCKFNVLLTSYFIYSTIHKAASFMAPGHSMLLTSTIPVECKMSIDCEWEPLAGTVSGEHSYWWHKIQLLGE